MEGLSVERRETRATVLHSVGGKRSTPALCLHGLQGSEQALWFAQGLSSGTVNITRRPVIAEWTDGGEASKVQLNFPGASPVTQLAWNAARSQLAIVHHKEMTFFYLSATQFVELETYSGEGSIRSAEWVSGGEPVLICLDEANNLVAYSTSLKTSKKVRCSEKMVVAKAGRFLDEVASVGEASKNCLYVWNLTSSSSDSSYTLLNHSQPVRNFVWCCTSDNCVLVTATSEELHLWSKCSQGSESCYIAQRQVDLSYRVGLLDSIQYQLTLDECYAILLCREENSPVLHRHMISTEMPTMVSGLSSIELEGPMDLACTEFRTIPTCGKGKHRNLVSLCSTKFLSLWKIGKDEEVDLVTFAPNSRGDQSRVELMKFHRPSRKVVTVDSGGWVHVWELGPEHELTLVDEFESRLSNVSDAEVGQTAIVLSCEDGRSCTYEYDRESERWVSSSTLDVHSTGWNSKKSIPTYILRERDDREIVSSSYSEDLHYLFILIRSSEKYHLEVWKKRYFSDEFTVCSTLLASDSIIAFDIVSLPCLSPMVLVCSAGRASMHNYDHISKEWQSSCISDMLPKNISSAVFLNSRRLLAVSNEEILVVPIPLDDSYFTELYKPMKAEKDAFDQDQLRNLYVKSWKEASHEKIWRGVPEFDAIWGLLNNCAFASSGSSFTWDQMRLEGIGYWINSKTVAASFFEKIAKAEFLRKRDPHDCTVFYIALGKVNILAGLCRATKSTKLGEFLKRNFNEEAHQVAALKNAYALLGQHRYQLSAAFFLLGRKYDDAIEICVKNLGDVQLGLCIALLTSTDDKDHYTDLIKGTLMPKAEEESLIHKWLLYCVMLKDTDAALNFLLSVVSNKEQWTNAKRSLSKSELEHTIHLMGDVYGILGLKSSDQNNTGGRLDFMANYSEIVSYLGSGAATTSWCMKLVHSLSDFPEYKVNINRLLASLVGKLTLSYSLSLHLHCCDQKPAFTEFFDDLLKHACSCLSNQLGLSGNETRVGLEGVLLIFKHALKQSASESKTEQEIDTPPKTSRRVTRKVEKVDTLPARVINRFSSHVEAIKVNPCDPTEATISSSGRLCTTKLDIPNKSNYERVDAECLYTAKFPKDCWTVPTLSANRTYMPQWAILNISKADVSASLLDAHPHRPLFLSNGVGLDVILLWHFHQQSAMSCYRLPPSRHKAKVRSFCFDRSGEKFSCIYSSGESALFSLDSLPSNGINIDCDACMDIFPEGEGNDVTFLGKSSSVVMGTGGVGGGGGTGGRQLFLWDSLASGSHRIQLRGMNPLKVYMGTSHTFVCGGDEGIALFDIRTMAPVMVPIWKSKQPTGAVAQLSGLNEKAASLHEDGSCRIWDLARKTSFEVTPEVGKFNHIDYTKAGLLLSSREGILSLL